MCMYVHQDLIICVVLTMTECKAHTCVYLFRQIITHLWCSLSGNTEAATGWNAEPVIHAGEAQGAVFTEVIEGGLFILITQTESIYVNDGEEQSCFHQTPSVSYRHECIYSCYYMVVHVLCDLFDAASLSLFIDLVKHTPLPWTLR